MTALLFEEVLEANCRAALDSVLAGLAGLPTPAPAPARVVYLAPGESIVWDDCCEGGQLTARLANLAAHRSQGQTVKLTPCSIDYWTATIEVVLLRCAATFKDNSGTAPTPDQLTVDGARGAQDLGTILRAITTLEFVDNVTSWTPQGPQGGCFGNGWNFTMKIDATPCD